MSKFKSQLLLLFCFLHSYISASSQIVKEPSGTPKEWSASYTPFRIVGNLYYVGTYDLACYLITTNKGNILINTGLASSTSLIKNNIEKLGFKFNDIKILLTTQAHYDHMGAMAEIKKITGAKFMVDEKDVDVLVDGGKSDYALGGKESSYAPIIPDKLLRNNEVVTLGNFSLNMLHHPGHTKGSCSFIFSTADKNRSYKVLIANMPSIVTEKNFKGVKKYPEIAEDYAYTFKSMKTLTFDIWLASHASQFNLHKKHKPTDGYHPEVFMDKNGYIQSLKELEKAYTEKIKNNK
ncbi:subclass B3 metallo-beta-lactamase [Pedobacter mendelii]|uniref:Subclass B3 metallo-beta-lactamase BJP-1 n=1 Tax=Pedobacter mendelii TaxID=1908240 RepID=A0ABQ2BEV1_9SPHI|nr:subclass B3 metallo-beta-lactamase [Pedobacter mendelii]GGI24499.1 subclass B3 metallo-beta-lactamase BJP-1 [Pedobacter mendelii]